MCFAKRPWKAEHPRKVAVGKDSIVAGCQKVSQEEQNRVPIGNKTYAITPSFDPCEFTKDSSKLSGDIPDNRLDPDMLKPLRENPYTIAFAPQPLFLKGTTNRQTEQKSK